MADLLEHREEQARREVGRTEVRHGVAVALTVLFLATVVAGAGLQPWLAPEGAERPAAQFDRFARQALAAFGVASRDGFFAGNRATHRAIDDLEGSVEDASWLRAAIRPRVQLLLSSALGAGNEQVYLSRSGRIDFRPGFDYVTGPPFLDERVLGRRRIGGDAWEPAPHPDPLPAIRAWTQALAERNIRLLLVPVPVKPTIEGRPGAELQNRSYDEWVDASRRLGAEVWDPAPVVLAAASAGEPIFLYADTHWRPEIVERVAAGLATEIERLVELAPPSATWRRQEVTVANRGDLFDLLGLPDGQRLVSEESVRVRRVVDSGRRLWRADGSAEVLLLGDSFTNVYSMPELGWGEGAGLAEQLSVALGRPVDKLAVNAGGAFGARERLVGELAAGTDRLTGKRIVVWQFAQRELAAGDWKPLELPPAPSEAP